jgi:Fic family protein
MSKEIEEKLDRLIALVRLAYRVDIESARKAVLADPVNAAILELAADQSRAAGDLKAEVQRFTGQSDRTVTRRIADLVAQGLLVQSGAGSKVFYRSSGLI